MKWSDQMKSNMALAGLLVCIAGLAVAIQSWDKQAQEREFGNRIQIADCQELGIREYVYWRKDWRLEQELCQELRAEKEGED